MKNIIYLRGRRVASSATQSFINTLISENLVSKSFLPSHMSADKAMELCNKQMGESFWSNSLKLVTVRNPYSNCVSIFLHKKILLRPNEQLTSPELEKYVQLFRNHIKSTYKEMQEHPARIEHCRDGNWQWNIYTSKDVPVVDDFIFYEKPKEGLLMLCEKMNITPVPEKISRIINNHSETSRIINNKYCYRDFYDDETRHMVSELRSKEIEYFNYTL